MGREARCEARFGRQASEGKALLETSEILFRGDFRLKIPFEGIQSVRAVNGSLVVRTKDGTATFALGAGEAAKWADRILHPRSVLDKLGVKPGMRVSVLGQADAALARDARARSATVSAGRLARDSDLVFLFADRAAALGKLKTARAAMKPGGGIWVIWPKGRPEFNENHVRAAAFSARLVDVKVVSYSPTHTGLKLVIRVAERRTV
jgi:hypothetical protein